MYEMEGALFGRAAPRRPAFRHRPVARSRQLRASCCPCRPPAPGSGFPAPVTSSEFPPSGARFRQWSISTACPRRSARGVRQLILL